MILRFRTSLAIVSLVVACSPLLLGVAAHAKPASPSSDVSSKTETGFDSLGLRLIGVVDIADAPRALISMKGVDGQVLVAPGDLVAGYTIERIGEEKIELARSDDRRIVTMRHLRWIKSNPRAKVYAANYKGANPDRPVKAATKSRKATFTPPDKTRPDFIHPMGGRGWVSSKYGLRNRPKSKLTGRHGTRNHEGIDIAAPIGTTVRASAAGTVTSSGYTSVRGNYVIVRHWNGWETRYLHLGKRYVKRGQIVKAGKSLGAEGNTGTSTGPHLHFEIRKNGRTLDPAKYVSSLR